MLQEIQQYIYLQHQKPPIKAGWLLLLLILLFIPHLYISFEWMMASQNPDLHIRIIGSRLLSTSHNPYAYYWHPGDAVELYNPNLALYSNANGVTTTPFFLWLQQPLANLSYCSIKKIWWMIEELLLALTIWFNIKLCIQRNKQLLVLLVITVFFLYSRNWWLHIYNGQFYVIFAFIFSLTHFCFIRYKNNVALWLYPFAALVRPFMVLALIPFISFTKRKILVLLLAASAAFFLFTVSTQLSTVKQYNDAMKIYATEETGGYTATAINLNYISHPYPTEPCVQKDIFQDSKLGAGCLFSVQHYLVRIGLPSHNTLLFASMLVIAMLFFWGIFKKVNPQPLPEQVVVFSFLLYLLCEFFTPASRNPYSLVQYLACVALVMNMINNKWLVILIIGFALNHDFPFRFIYQREIGELLILMSYISVLAPEKSAVQTPQAVV